MCVVCQFVFFFFFALSRSFTLVVFDMSRIYSLTYTYIHISNTQMIRISFLHPIHVSRLFSRDVGDRVGSDGEVQVIGFLFTPTSMRRAV